MENQLRSINVFSYGLGEIIKEISKKGTESDITLYNRKDGNRIMTFIEPSRYPDKISSLTDSIYPSDVAIVDGRKLDRFLGEVLVALDLFRKDSGIIFVDEYADTSSLRKIIKGTAVENYDFFSGSAMDLVERIAGLPERSVTDSPVAIVDHAFTVKSVGTVALGFVLSGTVKKHQDLRATYARKEVQVRSIQMQDADQEIAAKGSRVGLALKNISSDDIQRGEIFTDRKIDPVTKATVEMHMHPAVREKPEGKTEVFLADFMRFQRGTIENSTLEMDREFYPVSEWFVLARQTTFPRVFSRCRITK